MAAAPRTVEVVRWHDKEDLRLPIDLARHPAVAGVWIAVLDLVISSDTYPRATVRCGVLTDCPTAQDAAAQLRAMLQDRAACFAWPPCDHPHGALPHTEGITCTRGDLERAYTDGLTYYNKGTPIGKVFPIGAPTTAACDDAEFGCTPEERKLLAANVRLGCHLECPQHAVGRPFHVEALRGLSTRRDDGSWSPVRFALLSIGEPDQITYQWRFKRDIVRCNCTFTPNGDAAKYFSLWLPPATAAAAAADDDDDDDDDDDECKDQGEVCRVEAVFRNWLASSSLQLRGEFIYLTGCAEMFENDFTLDGLSIADSQMLVSNAGTDYSVIPLLPEDLATAATAAAAMLEAGEELRAVTTVVAKRFDVVLPTDADADADADAVVNDEAAGTR